MIGWIVGAVLGGIAGAALANKLQVTAASSLFAKPLAATLGGSVLGAVLFASLPIDGMSCGVGLCGLKPVAGQAAPATPPNARDAVMEVEDNLSFNRILYESKAPVLVDFYATWCGPCRAQAPVVEQLARDAGGKLTVAKVDVDRLRDLSSRHQVQYLPTLVVFRNGKEAGRLVGYNDAAKIKALVGL